MAVNFDISHAERPICSRMKGYTSCMAAVCLSPTLLTLKKEVYTVNVTELILNAVALGRLVLENGMEMDLEASEVIGYPQIIQVMDDHDLLLKPMGLGDPPFKEPPHLDGCFMEQLCCSTCCECHLMKIFTTHVAFSTTRSTVATRRNTMKDTGTLFTSSGHWEFAQMRTGCSLHLWWVTTLAGKSYWPILYLLVNNSFTQSVTAKCGERPRHIATSNYQILRSETVILKDTFTGKVVATGF